MAYDRRTVKGNVAYTVTLAVSIVGADTSIPISDGSTFPDGSAGPFTITLDPGGAGEEKVKIATRTGNTLTVATLGRGYDGTTAASHVSGVKVVHTISAVDLDEANEIVHVLMGGQSAPATAAKVLDNLGAPDLNETGTQTFAGPIESTGASSSFGAGAAGGAGAYVQLGDFGNTSVVIVRGQSSGGNCSVELQPTGTGEAFLVDASGNGVVAVGSTNHLGFFGTVPTAKPTVTGSRGGNAALASLLSALAGLGLITDSTTA